MSTQPIQIEFKNLIEMLDASCKRYKDQPLYGTKKNGNYEWTTYGEFATIVDQLRAGLSSLGGGPGDKLAISRQHTKEWAGSSHVT